jgi:ribosomal protein S18 acetylase RimI-like enzyme
MDFASVMTSHIVIRPARPDDAPLAAAVFRLSMEGMTEFLFGFDGRQAEIALMRLFSSDAGRFGYRAAHVAEWHRRALGMLISFPGAEASRLTLAALPQMFNILGVRFFGMAARSLSFANLREAEADEYLVSSLGVLPAAQGQGLGARLLKHADEQARARGLSKCALLVPTENETALRLYRKHGYEIISTHHHQKPLAGYHRMVKKL